MATLVIMAAGLGSRYGGLKQIDPIGPSGEILMEYTIYDAIQAGFTKVVFILRQELVEEFKELYGNRIAKHVEVVYAVQQLTNLPKGFTLPDGRQKPWGTAHAVYCAMDAINEPFCVINADDFYGREAFEKIHAFLENISDSKPYTCAMVGYRIENTLTENGFVSRGVCQTDADSMLTSIIERTKIVRDEKGIGDLESGVSIKAGTPVSMNVWGFPRTVLNDLTGAFEAFLSNLADPQKSEFYLPFYVDSLLKKGEATVQVLNTDTKWYGITYRDDKQTLVDAVNALTREGIYPEQLFS